MNESWWLNTLENTLIWARLRIRPAGSAEVFDSSGARLSYDSEDSARSALLDAGFVAYDGLDDQDARDRGFMLEKIVPPEGDSDAVLLRQMIQVLRG